MTEREFTEFFKKHYKSLVAHAYKIVRSVPDAEAVVQDALVIVYKNCRTENYEWRQQKAYAYLVTRCQGLNFLDKKKRKGRSKEIPCEWIEEGFSDIPEQPTQSNEKIIELAAECIDKLPRLQREIMYLHYFKGLDSGKIARVINRRASSVRTCIARGKDALKIKMLPAAQEAEQYA